MNSNPLHLCAGVFFTLLVDCRKPVSSYKDTWEADSELTNVDISDKLIRLVLDDFPAPNASTQKTHVSRMLNCAREKLGVSTPFYSDEYRETLQSDLSTDYNTVLLRWNHLLQEVIGQERQIICQRFADRLLAAIETDESFPGYHDPLLGCFLSRDELLERRNIICFQSFTLAVWAWICSNAPSNLIDAEALKRWREATPAMHTRLRFMTEDELKSGVPSPGEPEADQCGDILPADHTQTNSTISIPGQNTPVIPLRSESAVQNTDPSRYHLFVGLLDSDASSGYFMVPKDRALTEYTDDDFMAQFLPLTKDGAQALKQYPAVFLDELPWEKYREENAQAYLGFLTEIKPLSTGVKIYYSLRSVFKANDLIPVMDELDLHSSSRQYPMYGELTRTHWALKDVNVYEVLQKHGFEMQTLPGSV